MKKKTQRKKNPAPVYLRLFEVAKRLGVHRQSVWRDGQTNNLKLVEFGGIPMVAERDFEKYRLLVRERQAKRKKRKG